MSRRAWAFARYRFSTTLHHRWGDYVVVAVLIGAVGGVGLGSMAAARRTESSFPVYLASTRPSDFDVAVFTKQPENLRSQIAHLAGVGQVGDWVDVTADLVRRHGPAVSLLPSVQVVGSTGNEFFGRDRFTVTAGAMADPRRANQVMLSQSAAQILHLGVGQRFALQLPAGSPRGAPLRRQLTVVGIGLFNNQVVQDDVERLPTDIVATPAFTAGVPAADQSIRWYAVTVDRGSAGVSAVEREVVKQFRSYLVFHDTAVFAEQAELAIRPDAIALWVFGLIAGLSAILLAVQAIGRQVRLRQPELAVLRAIGADPTMTAVDGLLGTLGAVVAGAVLAAVVAVALSPLSPIGPARPVYPSPGAAVDWTVVGLGLAVLAGVVGACTVAVAALSAPHRQVGRPAAVRRGSAVVRQLVNAGSPPAVVIGVRSALEPGPGRTSAPVRSSIFGAALAMVIVTATLTFGSGLSSLVSHPALYGWNWNSALDGSLGYGPIPPVAQSLLNADHDVARWTGVTFFDMQLAGVPTPVLFVAAPAAFSPPILTGHALGAPDQIVLGPATLAALHRSVGDTVRVSFGSPPLIEPKVLRIVGTSTLRAIGISQGLHTSMGVGAMVPNGAFPNLSEQGYPKSCNGPNMALVRFRPGVSAAAGNASLTHIEHVTNHTCARLDPDNSCSLIVSLLGVQEPGQIRNYGAVGTSPGVLAGGLAGGAVVALGFTLVASVRRRRRELALLKALGFTQRQLAATVAWQASVAGVIGIAVGIPVGALLGRWLWTLFAREIYAVAQPVVPVVTLVLVAVGTVVLVNLVAAIPGRSAARTPTALVLRSD